MLEQSFGLPDIAKKVSGRDSHLTRSDFERGAVVSKMLGYAPRFLAFGFHQQGVCQGIPRT